MANWSDLKTAVASIVKANGNKEITGQLLQDVLNNIISNLGKECAFAGIATPETNPGTPDGNVFYIASDKGTYSNFNAITIKENEVVILEWKGISWQKKDIGVPTKERLNQLEQNLNESLNQLEETTNTKVGSALNQIESLKSTVLTYKLESYNNLVLRGTVVGAETSTKDDQFSTSEYISIYDNASKIIYTNTYNIQRDNYFVGIALYNKDRNTILYVGGGTGEVNLKDYPEAKYFRYCCGDRFDINQCSVSVIMEEPYKSLSELTTALEIVNTQIDSIEESISSSEKYKLNSYNSQVLRGDSIGISTFEGFSTSDYIEIKEGVKYIIYENTYGVQSGNYFAGFVLYNADRNLILYVGGDTGQVEISKYPEAKFFRYCCQNIKTCQVKAVIVGQKDESGLTFVNKNVFVDTIADTSEYITDENGEVWVGYDKVFEKNGVLGDYKISLYNCSEDDLGV